MSSSESWQRAREDVVLYCRRMQAERLVSWTAGNISKRVDGEPDLIAMTPTNTPYDTMHPEDVCIVRIDGSILDGHRGPTSEFPLHTLVYQRRAEVGAIVHTHSPAAMTMAALGWNLPPILTGFVEAAGGSVYTARYSRPGTAEMADFTAEALADRGACFLRHHGLLAIGSDIQHAFQAASVTEGAADVYLRARQFGEVPELPESEVTWIADQWRGQWSRRPSRGDAAHSDA
jgi:L-ribulose-5-phosphate 4-epimerase